MSFSISFIDKQFQVFSSEKEIVRIDYLPELPPNIKKYNLNDYQVYLFENCYFNKESDVFNVKLIGNDSINSDNGRDGFLLPLQVLDSNQELEDSSRHSYQYVAASVLLKQRIDELNKFVDTNKSLIEEIEAEFEKIISIPDIFESLYCTDKILHEYFKKNSNYKNICFYHNPIILIINRYQKTKINIENYKLSLFLYGYTNNRNNQRIANIKREFYIEKNDEKGVKTLNLIKTQEWINKKVINNLFSDIFTSSESIVFRFLILYQNVEYLMDEIEEEELINLKRNISKLDLSNNSNISKIKNDIQNLRKEGEYLKKLFQTVEISPIFDNDVNIFRTLYRAIVDSENNDKVFLQIYGMRNKLFHSYREYVNIPDFEKLVFYACKVLIELIIALKKILTQDELKNKIINQHETIIIHDPVVKELKLRKIGKTKIDNISHEAFQYELSNNCNYVPFETLFRCYSQIEQKGYLEKKWYSQEFPKENKNRPTNFYVIGSLLVYFNVALYHEGNFIRK